jgi:hypothetical protein
MVFSKSEKSCRAIDWDGPGGSPAAAGPIAQRVRNTFGVDNAELPIASTSVEDLVAWIGPTGQRYLTDPSPANIGP